MHSLNGYDTMSNQPGAAMCFDDLGPGDGLSPNQVGDGDSGFFVGSIFNGDEAY